MSMEGKNEGLKEEQNAQEKVTKEHGKRGAEEKVINPGIVFAFILLFFFAVFAVMNTQEVTISFVLTNMEVPLILVILGSFFLGVITMALSTWRSGRKKTKH